MKLKYYLRGVGIGIIFATLVMTVSCAVHNYNLSDEFIIKEAMKLGMVMKNHSEDNNSIWGSDDTVSTEESASTEELERTENTESTQVAGGDVADSEIDTGTVSESESVSESTSESESNKEPQTPVEPPMPSESQTPVEPPMPSESQKPTHVTIVVERGDYARQVAEKLFAAGVVEDAEEFRKYMGAHGYAKSIHAGTYSIPVDATYEEICKIVAG